LKIASFDLDQKVFIVAEIGNNHEGNLELAKRLIGLAAEAGVDAVKFQTIVPERLVTPDQVARIQQLGRFQLGYAAFETLAKVAEREGVLFLSTPFDRESATFLTPLVPAFKIASGDNDFFPLLETVAATGKPILLSTGLCDLAKASAAKTFIEGVWRTRNLIGELALLHCVASYPTPVAEANLLALVALQRLGSTVGYSDHTLGTLAAVLSVPLGARIIEKHFTLAKDYSSFRDHQLAADPQELALLVRQVREAAALLGDGQKKLLPCEEACSVGARRSIVAGADLSEGTILSLETLNWLRPGSGLSPAMTGELLGRQLSRPVRKGVQISLDDLR
jgi:N-acetylneuraminate synthase/N,N'-diacetyllegionaminate synthase